MPYITQEERKQVHGVLSEASYLGMNKWPSGMLNYVITKLVVFFLGSTPNYERFNSAVGVLESVKLELYRRPIAAYEDWKCNQNGDVYGP